MSSTITHLAAAIRDETDPARRARLEEYAVVLLRLGILRWRLLQLLCGLQQPEAASTRDGRPRSAAAA
jgi:hypothetical protein